MYFDLIDFITQPSITITILFQCSIQTKNKTCRHQYISFINLNKINMKIWSYLLNILHVIDNKMLILLWINNFINIVVSGE